MTWRLALSERSASDPKARKVAAVISDSDYAGVVAISPPRACWNWRSA
jgi:hypothetical protein